MQCKNLILHLESLLPRRLDDLLSSLRTDNIEQRLLLPSFHHHLHTIRHDRPPNYRLTEPALPSAVLPPPSEVVRLALVAELCEGGEVSLVVLRARRISGVLGGGGEGQTYWKSTSPPKSFWSWEGGTRSVASEAARKRILSFVTGSTKGETS